MKQKILSALEAKFEGVNANILNRIADMLAKTVKTDEEVITAVEGITKDYIDIIEAYGDSRATNAQKTAVANYENKYGLRAGEKVSREEPKAKENKTDGSDDTPAWARELIQNNKELTERLNRMEGDRPAASRKHDIDAIVGKLPETLRKGYSRISLDTLTDEEFNALKGEITTEVEAINRDVSIKSAVFGRPTNGGLGTGGGGGNVTEATEAEVSAVVDKMNI